MRHHTWRRASAAARPVAAGLLALLAVTACSDDGPRADGDEAAPETAGLRAEIGTLPDEARAIMEKAPYASARWLYYVADAATGEVLLANRPDELVFTASTGKNFVVGSVYETLGPDTTLTTPVFATTPVSGGVIDGDLVLVASGDLALGGRNAMDGRFDHTFNAESVDHVYSNIAPNGARVGDPLAGLDDLARQIVDNGVTSVAGDVVIDTRLWEPFVGVEGAVPPIFVNDNILDVEVTAADEGAPATVETFPATDYFTIRADVVTVAAGGETVLDVVASEDDPNVLTVSGTIAEGGSQLALHRVPDGAAWARALFIEALQRAGIELSATASGPNDESGLPAEDLPAEQELARLESPPLSAMGTMINEVSYNMGANAFLCLLAVELGSTRCTDGLATMYELAAQAGLDTDVLFLVDGQGADPASTTPRQISRWMQWSLEQPWGEVLFAGQPVLAGTGSLAANGIGSPAAGKVHAKVGTSVVVDPVTGRLYSKVQALAGYMTLEDGTVLVFGLYASGSSFPVLYDGLVEVGEDLAQVVASFQQALSES